MDVGTWISKGSILADTMKAYWSFSFEVVESDEPVILTLEAALNAWADGSGGEGDFFGLVDSLNRTIQFLFVDSIPDDFEDAGQLSIVLVDFPVPERRGSWSKIVTITESSALIEKAFRVGASFADFEGLEFSSWD